MGALGVRCGDSADLLFSSVVFDTTTCVAGGTVRAGAVVRNEGPAGAGRFRVDFYEDLEDPPVPGMDGDLSAVVDTIAPGDSARVEFELSSGSAGTWRSWLLIDPAGDVPEYDGSDNTAGPFTITWVNPGGEAPEATGLSSVSPNPFEGSTEIVYDLDRPAAALVAVYDATGRRLKVWKLPPAGPGRFHLTWRGTTDDGKEVSPGVYFVRFVVEGVVEQSRGRLTIVR